MAVFDTLICQNLISRKNLSGRKIIDFLHCELAMQLFTYNVQETLDEVICKV